MRASVEVADIFRAAGPAYRATHAGHMSLVQLKVMSAIEHCRTAALGGHVEACEDCGHWRIAYNSCRNRHCPKCQAAAARTWLAEREADLLPVGYLWLSTLRNRRSDPSAAFRTRSPPSAGTSPQRSHATFYDVPAVHVSTTILTPVCDAVTPGQVSDCRDRFRQKVSNLACDRR